MIDLRSRREGFRQSVLRKKLMAEAALFPITGAFAQKRRLALRGVVSRRECPAVCGASRARP
jgi:hypothetical protein